MSENFIDSFGFQDDEFTESEENVRWKYIKTQIYSLNQSFAGILTSFEWTFGLFCEIWRHIWRQNKS